MNRISKKEEIKEDFCPACLAIPLAFVGAGAAAAGGTISDKHKKWKKTLLVSGILTLLMCVALGIYYLMNKDNCTECKIRI
jgi:nitrate/nitrite transporter NarK